MHISINNNVFYFRKYERSKQITMQLKESEEQLIEEKKQLLQQLKAQEQRYDQMKSHAVQQLDL